MKNALISVFWCYFLFFRLLFFFFSFYSLYGVWGNVVWVHSNSLEIIFVLCGTIYSMKNKFVSQQKLNALNHIATAVCVCAPAFFESCFFTMCLFSFFQLSMLLFMWSRWSTFMLMFMLTHDLRKWNLDIICPSKNFQIHQCFRIFVCFWHFQSHKRCEV